MDKVFFSEEYLTISLQLKVDHKKLKHDYKQMQFMPNLDFLTEEVEEPPRSLESCF